MKDKVYITRIIKYAEKIGKYMNNVSSYEAFESNEEKIDAVTMNLNKLVRLRKNSQMKLKNDILK